jgi:hypothetical protein
MPLESAPPAPVDPAAVVQPATKFEDAKAARREAPVEPAADPAKPAVAIIDMDEGDLKAAVALSKESRAARAKIKELEPAAGKVKRVAELVAAGKHREAIEELGIDLNAAVAESLGVTAEVKPEDAAAAKVQADLEALKASDAERKEREKADGIKAADAARVADMAAVVEHVKEKATEYPYLARKAEWVHAAYEDAAKAYPALVEKAGRELNAIEKDRLIKASLAEAEEFRKGEAKLYAPVTLDQRPKSPPPKASARPTFDSSLRGGTAAPVVRSKTKLSFEQAKAERRRQPG